MYCKYLCTFTPTFALGAECIYYMNVVLNFIKLLKFTLMFKNQIKNCSNLTPLPFFYYLVIFQQQKFNYNFFYKFLKIKHYVNDEQYIG